MDRFDIPAFKFKQIPPNEVRDEWVRYKRHFEYLALANAITNKTRLKHIFLAKAGPDVQEVFSSIPGADVEEGIGVNPFEVAIDKLDAYFAPKQHEAYQRFLFWSLKPQDKDESLDKFLLRSMELANKCNFGNTRQESAEISVIDKLIQLSPPDLREKLLHKDHLTLDEVTKIVNTHESIKFQAGRMFGANASHESVPSEINKIHSAQRDSGYECSRCGRRGHSGMDRICPARNKPCDLCRKIGHFARCCRTTRPAQKRKFENRLDDGETSRKRLKYEAVRHVDNLEEGNGEDSVPCFVFNVGDGDAFLWVSVGGVLIQMLIDSGCQKNIIDDVTWANMQEQGVKVENRRSNSDQNFRAYGKASVPLVVKQVFEAVIRVENNEKRIEKVATFYVIEAGSQPLLGRITAKDLGVLVLGLPSTDAPEVFRLALEQKRPFPKLKGVLLTIPIDRTVTPVCQHARRPPLALLDKIEQKLESLQASDIIEPVNEYSQWVSPLVTIVKDNGDLRLCVDMRRANLAIKREGHLMPTFDDFLPLLRNAKVFSRLDIKDAFHQLELHESCRDITTFITHKGMYRYKRLMFGISCAPEMFQKVLEQVLADCENVVSFIDDILIFGGTEEEHDRALEKVMNALKSRNILLNHDKCVYKVKEVDFLGHHVSENGIKPTEDKMAVLKSFRAPHTAEELRSFLGLVTYVGRFLPNLATISAPLRQLTHTGVKFDWKSEHEEAFRKLKEMVTDIKTLHYFDSSLRTRVVADASPVGLGAVLIQFSDPNNDFHPRVVSYASKSLSPTEKRYCQTEKEALALVWAVERFSVYLLGRKFELETDHKPLEVIFGSTSRPCARIERWLLRLQAYTFVVRYRKGSENVADSLSRLPEFGEDHEFDGDNQFLVLAIMESAAIDISELEKASKDDLELLAVQDYVRFGKWSAEVKPFEPFHSELGLTGDILVRGTKLVVPRALRNRMLILAHEGHPGETVMKRRLRDRVWWPGMDREISKYVTACEGCRLVGLPNRPEPMQRRELPTKPWVDVALDFMGPLPTGENLMVIVDYFSRYKEVEILKQITAEETTTRLHKIFTRLGFPATITLDNARQFVSAKFETYCKDHGIRQNYSTPYWPQENGLVERQNRSLLKRLQISHALGRDWKNDLMDYLMMYYSTPHSITGKTPTEMMYGHTIRSKIPCLGDIETTPRDDEVSERDRVLKEKGKEREDQRRLARESGIQAGDTVLLKNLLPGNKLTPTFNPTEYLVLNKEGSRVTVRNKVSDKVYRRNVAHVKRVVGDPDKAENSQSETEQLEPTTDESSPSTSFKNLDQPQHLDRSRMRREVKLPDRFKDFVISE
ncbi:uncharacterized protein K02A2.6-like [Aedes albopictus]|uniref:RNA-directed DNA polymerase n=1 Tax=Aedes albopictus TaxID=7160 RepID=A0ABM2A3J6_AEDAL